MGVKWNRETGPGEKLLRLFSLLLFTQERYSLGAQSRQRCGSACAGLATGRNQG